MDPYSLDPIHQQPKQTHHPGVAGSRMTKYTLQSLPSHNRFLKLGLLPAKASPAEHAFHFRSELPMFIQSGMIPPELSIPQWQVVYTLRQSLNQTDWSAIERNRPDPDNPFHLVP